MSEDLRGYDLWKLRESPEPPEPEPEWCRKCHFMIGDVDGCKCTEEEQDEE